MKSLPILGLEKCHTYDQVTIFITALLEKGANIDAVDKEGMNPLFDALRYQNFPLFDILLKAGSNVNVARTRTGQTPLHFVCGYQAASCPHQVQIVHKLIKAGARVDTRDHEGKCMHIKTFL